MFGVLHKALFFLESRDLGIMNNLQFHLFKERRFLALGFAKKSLKV